MALLSSSRYSSSTSVSCCNEKRPAIAIGFPAGARKGMNARCVYTSDTRDLAITWHRRTHTHMGPYYLSLLERAKKIPCPTTRASHGARPDVLQGKLVGREIGGGGWVKWPQLDLQYHPEWLLVLAEFIFLIVGGGIIWMVVC